MALVPLATSRAACLYAGGDLSTRPFGGMVLVRSLVGGTLGVLAKYHFADGASISHIAAAALTPTSFAVGFRAPPDPSAPPGRPSRELSLVWVGMRDNELIVGPRPLVLEPSRAGVRARSLALVSRNLLACSYESELEQRTKVVLVRVDPETHRMAPTGRPEVIARGHAAFVEGVSLPSGPASPRTFTLLQLSKGRGVAAVCGVSAAGRAVHCREATWADSELVAASGSRLPDGRLAVAFADAAGEPFYQLLPGAGGDDA